MDTHRRARVRPEILATCLEFISFGIRRDELSGLKIMSGGPIGFWFYRDWCFGADLQHEKMKWILSALIKWLKCNLELISVSLPPGMMTNFGENKVEAVYLVQCANDAGSVEVLPIYLVNLLAPAEGYSTSNCRWAIVPFNSDEISFVTSS